MARSTVTLMVIAALGVILVAAGCNSGSSTGSNYGGGGGGGNGGGGGGGGTQIFASGDIVANASYTHVFNTAQVIPYHCRYHGAAGGVGMSGTITVSTPGAYYTPVRHVFNIVTTALPSPAIYTGDTITWVNMTAMTHTCESDH